MRRGRVALLSAVAAAAVALPSLRNGFVIDDLWVVKDRAVLLAPSSAAAVLREPYWPRSFGGGLWRPLVLASWSLDYRVSHQPWWFHFTNIVWAGVAAGLLALLAAQLAGPTAGLIAGLLFAVHPVHVEAAASVVGRAELRAAAGYALALLCALRVKQSAWWLAGVLLGSALAIGSKEHAATLPVAIVLVLFWLRRGWRDFIAPAVTAAIPIAVYFWLRAGVVGGALNPGGLAPGLEGLSLPQRAVAMLGVSLQWWRLLFFPAHLSADWATAQVAVVPDLTPDLLLAAALWLGAALVAWRLRRSTPGLWLGVLWFVITIGPVTNVLVPTEVVLAERTLYLPSWGAMLALGVVIAMIPRRAIATAAVAVIALAFAARSVVRNEAWLDSAHMYAALQRDAPRSYRTLWRRGDDAFAHGEAGTGERLLRESMVAAPGIPGPAEDLAQRYAAAGLVPQAAELLRHAGSLNTTRSRPWILLANILLESGRCAEADSVIRERGGLFTPVEQEQAKTAVGQCRAPGAP